MVFEYLYDTAEHTKWQRGMSLTASRLDYIESKLKELATMANQCVIAPGTIKPFDLDAPPVGWLECNGAVVNRADYPALFATIGTRHNTGGELTTQFRLPDLRGEFIRGWDHGRGVDPGRILGSAQAENVGAHQHTYGLYERRNHWTPELMYEYKGHGSIDSISLITEGNPTGENRPRNIALLYCIKI